MDSKNRTIISYLLHGNSGQFISVASVKRIKLLLNRIEEKPVGD